MKRTGNGGQQESWGAISELGWANSGTGYFPVPSADIKDRIEDGPLEWQWFTKNVVAPALGLGVPTRPVFLDPEYSEYDYFWNEWRVGKQGDRVATYPGGWTSPGNGYRTGGGF